MEIRITKCVIKGRTATGRVIRWREESAKSLEEIRAKGVRFRQLSERANGMMVNSVVMDSPIPLFGGSGVYINGGTIGGLDLMAVFTKTSGIKKEKNVGAYVGSVENLWGFDDCTDQSPH